MVENKIKDTILNKKLIGRNEHIIVGLSGGPDSVCLFNALMNLSDELNFTISAVHINHKFRPIAAEEDQAYVEALCKSKDIECYSFVYDCNAIAAEKGISGEEAGRLIRYESFYNVAKQLIDNKRYDSSQIKIAVAHNLNDQAETLLMRIIRGTGTEGLAGIEYSRSGEYGTRVIRPLLDVSRDEIEDYCEKNNLNPRIDHTNSEAIYTRNKIRLNLIPLIEKEFNSNVIEALNRLSKIAKEDKEYFDLKVNEAMEEAAMLPNGISFGLGYLREMQPSIRHRVVKRAFESLGLEQGIASIHLEAVDKLIDGSSDSSSTELPKGYGAVSSYGEVRFFKNDPVTLGYVSHSELKSKLMIRIVRNGGTLKDISQNGTKRFAAMDLNKLLEKLWSSDTPYLEQVENSTITNKDFEERMSEEIHMMVQIRTRRQGDWIVPLGMKGTKKIQDLFVDEKVYKECRDIVPLVCIGDEVIWIIGDDVSGFKTGMKKGRISENYKLCNDTKDIVLLEYLE
ncbi:MAG: tRNA lysidine(34) synthetase TilS [Aminipila sp.]